MNPLDLAMVFGLGVVSSLHCVQMCGPLVLAFSLPLARGGGGRANLLAAQAAYHGGRTLVYALLGALAGMLGGAFGMLGRMAGMANSGRILAGVAMLAGGIAMIGLFPSNGLVAIERRGVVSWFKHAVARLMISTRPAGKFQLGLILGFLPCGLIYAALLKAVDAGAALPGALTMLAFGLGTAPALLAVGVASVPLGRILGPWSNRLAAASLLLMGAFLLWRGIAAPPSPHCHVNS